jgi:hypothetical protein
LFFDLNHESDTLILTLILDPEALGDKVREAGDVSISLDHLVAVVDATDRAGEGQPGRFTVLLV